MQLQPSRGPVGSLHYILFTPPLAASLHQLLGVGLSKLVELRSDDSAAITLIGVVSVEALMVCLSRIELLQRYQLRHDRALVCIHG